MPPAGAVVTAGSGRQVVLLHATGADKGSWQALTALLAGRARCTAFDRRGSITWPVTDGERSPDVGAHADDAAAVITALGVGPVAVCGASFGAVVGLELVKRWPGLVRGAVLFEPALSGSDDTPSVPDALASQVERLAGGGDAAAAAEWFFRRLLGDAAWSRLPHAAREEMRARGRAIAHDLRANQAYRVDYASLGRVSTPVLLLKGGQSRLVFEGALRALHAALPHARRAVLPSAAHVPSGQGWREFADAAAAFLDEVC
jgi:pimeloyl-ACP methyl ester carboxylesterase